MTIPNTHLHEWLPRFENNSAQHEYYLADIITMAVKQGAQITAFLVSNFFEIMGVNSKRQPVELDNKVPIGNFVEVKNSQIAMDNKINRMSYTVDLIVYLIANVGASTIICNCGGANKHPTIIEDDVFIESDTQLIASVKVSRGSTIGKGFTISK